MVVINLDRPRILRFGHKALKLMTTLTGKDFNNFEIDNANFEDLEKIMYCGLLYDAKENNETLKLEDMEDLLDEADTYTEIMEKMQLALDAAFGQMAADQKNLQRIVDQKKKK
ncbi:hypothetical protein AN964_14055 [Heyndrickxia shackletonii]|uniref:Uncharacterized protein n=2 Tax=Heyndrickxia shackletonii TaxID=157838 RepID=A0A0Q3TNC8_9BACI|nr:hypothetical protein AN964_14055 [Heyndrickxia shackletonii]NEY99241.1 hypothetical protein [Heyndrickxia shackletonii]